MSLSQNKAFSTRSDPGTREVKPTTPWTPGVSPVPSDVRLVAVVDGTPEVPAASGVSNEDRYGAASACAASRSAPSPSTRKTTYAGPCGRTSAGCSAGQPGTRAPSANATAGRTSASDLPPYAGSTNPVTASGSAVGSRRERLGEGQQGRHGVGAVGGRRDPDGEV